MQGILTGEVDFEGALTKILPKQKEFISSTEKFAAYIGGFGSGKTVAGCLSMILLGQQIPNSLILIARLNYPALRDTTRRTFLELFPLDWVAENGRGWKESENRLIARNGTEYLFRHLDMADAHQKAHIRSLNLTAFLVDEAPETNEDVFLTLAGRLRRKNAPAHFGRLVGNPAGQDWIYRRFFDPKRPEKWRRIHRGIVAPTTENTNLPSDYVSDLISVYPTDWIERYIHGSFADFSDLVYKDWDFHVHIYEPTRKYAFFEGNYDPPSEWPTLVGVDIGGIDPWCFLFIKVAPNGMLFVVNEIYEAGILIRALAEQYFAIMDGHALEGLAYDYENQQAAFELAEHGISGTPAVKDRLPGIFKVGQYLHPDPRLVNPFTGIAPSPRLFVSSRCTNLVRELSAYKWAKDRNGQPTGEPADGNDHSCDALRYAIHTFRPEPAKIKPPSAWENKELDELSRMFWRDVERQQKRTDKRRKTKRFFSYSPIVIR